MATHITYEHSASNTLAMPTQNLTVTINRPYLSIDINPSGDKVVTDPGVIQRVFSFTTRLSGDDWNTLHDWLNTTITYSGDYPRITTVYWDGDTSESNIEVAITSCSATMRPGGDWNVSLVMREKTK